MAEEKKKVVLATDKTLDNKSYWYEIIESGKSAVNPSGSHVVLNVLGLNDSILEHTDLSARKQGLAIAKLISFLNARQEDGKWTLGLNGPKMGSRTTFHPHGIIPGEKGQILRLIFNPSKWLASLEVAIQNKDWEAVKAAVTEFKKNLK